MVSKSSLTITLSDDSDYETKENADPIRTVPTGGLQAIMNRYKPRPGPSNAQNSSCSKASTVSKTGTNSDAVAEVSDSKSLALLPSDSATPSVSSLTPIIDLTEEISESELPLSPPSSTIPAPLTVPWKSVPISPVHPGFFPICSTLGTISS